MTASEGGPSSFRQRLLQDLEGLELTLLSHGDVVGKHVPASVNENDDQLWLAYRAAIADIRITEALPLIEVLAESPPLVSTRRINESWPEIRGAIEWRRYSDALARGGPATPIPYWARHLSASGPELVVLVATLAADITVLRALLGKIGRFGKAHSLRGVANKAAAALSRPPLSEVLTAVRDAGADMQSLVPQALERLERGRAWSPGAAALYQWIVKWLTSRGEQSRLREVLLRGEGLDDTLYELWCAKRLASAMAAQLGSSVELESYPVFERHLKGYAKHGEIFALELPSGGPWSKLAGKKLRLHFQRSRGVLTSSRIEWGEEPIAAWERISGSAGLRNNRAAARLIPDLVVSLGRLDADSKLVHAQPPIIADSKNRQSTGSDERLKMLGYLQAFSHYARQGKVFTALTFVRAPSDEVRPSLFVNDVMIPVPGRARPTRAVKAVFEFPAEPGATFTGDSFQQAAKLVLRRLGIR